jgi:hypothetical protein
MLLSRPFRPCSPSPPFARTHRARYFGLAAPRTPFIHDIGWRWRICCGFQWLCEQLTLNLRGSHCTQAHRVALSCKGRDSAVRRSGPNCSKAHLIPKRTDTKTVTGKGCECYGDITPITTDGSISVLQTIHSPSDWVQFRVRSASSDAGGAQCPSQ